MDSPAMIEYNDKGDVREEHYLQNSKYHRDGAPAEINYDDEGKVRGESYYQNGNLVR